MQKLELLAPAQSAAIGIAAIRCGADAVYIGGPAYGARVAASNSIEDIRRLCAEAAPFGVRIYVTLNTLARDEAERKDFVRMALALKGSGISAFIIQDASLMPLLAAHGPWKEEFHASTQCAIRTPERALQLESIGFTRLILERQLSLEQVRAIRKVLRPETELEFFVHGALCVCYSGDCYLSEALTGRSANRGECAQPCRNRYDLVDGNGQAIVRNKPLLSLRDLQLIDRLEDLAGEGICSFKIEGRLKNESYVKNIVRAYSLALDKVVAAHPDKYCRSSLGHIEDGFVPDTNLTFNRGYTSLFLDGRRGGHWQSGDAAKAMGQMLGKVVKINAVALKKAYGEVPAFFIELDSGIAVHNGDGLCFVDAGGEVCGIRADKVEGRKIYCKAVPGLKVGVQMWRNLDIEFERKLESCRPKRLIDVGLDLHFGADGTLRVEIVAGNGINGMGRERKALTYPCADFPSANDRARMESLLEGQLGKSSGNYSFRLARLQCELPALPLLSSSFINGIRRDAAEALQKQAECLCTVGDFDPTHAENKVCGIALGDSDPQAAKNRVCGMGLGVSDPKPAEPQSVADKTANSNDSKQAAANLSHPRREGELMRSKYCILSELGLCRKKSQKGSELAKNGIYLRNNNRLLRLDFDCAACEMVVLAASANADFLKKG